MGGPVRRWPFGEPIELLANERPRVVQERRDEEQLAKLEQWLAEQWQTKGEDDGGTQSCA